PTTSQPCRRATATGRRATPRTAALTPVPPGAAARERADRRTSRADAAPRVPAAADALRRPGAAMGAGAADARARGERAGSAVLHAGAAGLDGLPGVGPHTARSAVAAAERLAQTLRAGARLRIEPGSRGPLGLELVTALHRLMRIEPLLAPEAQHLADFSSSV